MISSSFHHVINITFPGTLISKLSIVQCVYIPISFYMCLGSIFFPLSFLFPSFFLKKFTMFYIWKKRTTVRRNFHSFVYIYMKKM